jgi:hypothetical protein
VNIIPQGKNSSRTGKKKQPVIKTYFVHLNPLCIFWGIVIFSFCGITLLHISRKEPNGHNQPQ